MADEVALPAAAPARVVNGEHSALGRYPFLATQGDRENDWFYCGASLIRKDWVLTAGHCMYNNPDWQLAVRLQFGRFDLNLSNDEEGGIVRRVVDFVKFPEYNAWKNDIGLLKLAGAVPASVATPVALDAGGEARAGRDAILAGWGSLDEACSVYTAVQQEANLTIASFDECSNINGEMTRWYPRNNGTTLCAGRFVGDDDAGSAAGGAEWAEAGCGDSGGPLIVYDATTGEPTQVGVVSWGYGHTHTVYARVSAFKAWIDGIVDECADSAHWHKRDEADKTCERVAANPTQRCSWVGPGGTTASQACPVACTTGCACADSTSWHKRRRPSKRCTEVAQNPTARCDWVGSDGSLASESCPLSCSTCGG